MTKKDELTYIVSSKVIQIESVQTMIQVARLLDIKNKLQITDETLCFYIVDNDGTIRLRKASDYELLAEEGLKEVYDNEPEGLWEKCLDD